VSAKCVLFRNLQKYSMMPIRKFFLATIGYSSCTICCEVFEFVWFDAVCFWVGRSTCSPNTVNYFAYSCAINCTWEMFFLHSEHRLDVLRRDSFWSFVVPNKKNVDIIYFLSSFLYLHCRYTTRFGYIFTSEL